MTIIIYCIKIVREDSRFKLMGPNLANNTAFQKTTSCTLFLIVAYISGVLPLSSSLFTAYLYCMQPYMDVTIDSTVITSLRGLQSLHLSSLEQQPYAVE